MKAPKEGDIITFKPELDTKGREQQGERPWLVVSTSPYNDASKLVMVCPITTHQGKAERANPAEVLLPPGCGAKGVVLTFQIQTIDWHARNVKITGRVQTATLKAVLHNLSICLGI